MVASMISVEQFKIIDNDVVNLYKGSFRVLSCNLLWIIVRKSNDFLHLSVTDNAILQHYFDNEYYIKDPEIQFPLNYKNLQFHMDLATDCNNFKENGFLHDIYKMFHITEFVSISTQVPSGYYSFRFFTQVNRFLFMNNLLKNIPIIKILILNYIKNFNINFDSHQNHYDLFHLTSH